MTSTQGVVRTSVPASARPTSTRDRRRRSVAGEGVCRARFRGKSTRGQWWRCERAATLARPCSLTRASVSSADGAQQLLFRGLRLKVGIDHGEVHASVNPSTGRMCYRSVRACSRRDGGVAGRARVKLTSTRRCAPDALLAAGAPRAGAA